jgi:hypothetical protein
MPETGTQIRALDQHDLIELPASGNLLTILVEIPPHDEGTPAHRHPGPVYAYMIEGEMIFELEGDPPARSAPGSRMKSSKPAATGATRDRSGARRSDVACTHSVGFSLTDRDSYQVNPVRPAQRSASTPVGADVRSGGRRARR